MSLEELTNDLQLSVIDLGRLGTLKVLAADDHAYNREVLRCLLGMVDIEPEIVEDGEELVSAWLSGDYNIILTDIEMPRLNGLLAARAIRRWEARAGAAPIPILAITANADGYPPEEFKALRLSAVLSKPVRPKLLFSAMLAAVRQGPERARPRLREERSFGTRHWR